MEQLQGVVERITFYNEQNGYTVLRLQVAGEPNPVTVVGRMTRTSVGAVLQLEGEWTINGKYGRQFSAVSCSETLPATVHGLEKYLGSGLIPGIGPKYAKKIVDFFGPETLVVLETEPERLREVPGIGEKRARQIQEGWTQQRQVKNIMLFLQGYDVSTALAYRIWKQYGDGALAVMRENPYRLADEVWGVGFKTADTIAGRMGFASDAFVRVRAGLLYAMTTLAEEGHCFAFRDQLLDQAGKLLQVETGQLEAALEVLLQTGELQQEDEALYLPKTYQAEREAARLLSELRRAANPVLEKARAAGGAQRVLDWVMERAQQEDLFQYDEIQRQAIQAALENKVLVLTGGPGTGKTTTTLGMITVFRALGCRVLLAAPTGRAAKRLSEATGMEAKTIHRLLEYKPPEGYQRGPDNPLVGDVLLVDECSMIDLELMQGLLRALPLSMTLVLVGDSDQLPSVGAGNVLRDVIASGVIPVVRLERIFRQAQGSRIIQNAHRVNRGEPMDLNRSRDSDFFFLPVDDPEAAAQEIVTLCRDRLPGYYGVDRLGQIQVLSPMQRGPVGTIALNTALQAALNPQGPSLRRGSTEFRLGDKVMQIRNDYEKDVFNGDIGIVTAVDEETQELVVGFDGRNVFYAQPQLDELRLAYAVTVHKSQGSEYPIVVLPVMTTHYIMLQRNLLYTAITRAKKVLVILGQKKAINIALRNVSGTRRNTRLAQRLTGELPE